MEKDNETTIVEEHKEAATEAAPKPTREELSKAGWTKGELDAAEKHDMIAKPATAEPGKEPAKPEPAPAAADELEKAPEPEKPKPGKPGGIIGVDDVELTADQEKELLAKFPSGHPVRGLYFRQKSERRARQAVEAREKKKDARIAELEAQLAGKVPAPAADVVEDDEDAPVTKKMLIELDKQKAEKEQRDREELEQRYQEIGSSQVEQEEYVKSIHADFDEVTSLAKEIITKPSIITEPWRQKRALRLFIAMREAAANADKFGLDDDHAAFLAYELGQMHPNYGKPKAPAGGAPRSTDGPSKEIPKPTGGSIKPETLERIEKNTQRRSSSAQVPSGGGSRTIAPEDVTLADLDAMDYRRREAFSKANPDHYARLMRG